MEPGISWSVAVDSSKIPLFSVHYHNYLVIKHGISPCKNQNQKRLGQSSKTDLDFLFFVVFFFKGKSIQQNYLYRVDLSLFGSFLR